MKEENNWWYVWREKEIKIIMIYDEWQFLSLFFTFLFENFNSKLGLNMMCESEWSCHKKKTYLARQHF